MNPSLFTRSLVALVLTLALAASASAQDAPPPPQGSDVETQASYGTPETGRVATPAVQRAAPHPQSAIVLASDQEPGCYNTTEYNWVWVCGTCYGWDSGNHVWRPGVWRERQKRICQTCGGTRTCGPWTSDGLSCSIGGSGSCN